MLFDTTYSDKRTTKMINEAVGLPFPFLQRIKMGGIGSKRMVIQDIGDDYKKYLKAEHYQSHANIELRPHGLIIHFRHKLEAYSWVMPYASLSLDQSPSFKLVSEGKHISFDQELDEKFISKLQKAFSDFSTTKKEQLS